MFRQDVVCRRGNYEREPFGVPGGSPASNMNGGGNPLGFPPPGAQACAARQSAFFMKFQTITTMTSSPLREMMSRISSRDMSLS